MYQFCVLMLLYCLVSTRLVQSQTLRYEACSGAAQEAVITSGAEAMIGGLFGMHYEGDNGCGEMSTGEFQAYEAIRWALERINKKGQNFNGDALNDTYVPGVRIGMRALDYCDMSPRAVRDATSFFPQMGAEQRSCTEANPSSLMLGLIGASTSGATKDVEKFAEDNKIPLVSFMATAPELSDRKTYPYFLRTVAPDGPLMEVIALFLKHLKWDFVTVVYTDTFYGNAAFSEIRSKLASQGICLTVGIKADPADVSNGAMDDILSRVLATETKGVIYLGTRSLSRKLLSRADTYAGAGKLQWIFTDSVSLSDTFPNMKYPRGIVAIVPGSRSITEFEDHWIRIDPNNPDSENPWFKEMYMSTHECKLPGVNYAPYNVFPVCPVQTEAQRRSMYVQDVFVEPAVHAVYTYARALREAQKDLCGRNFVGICPALKALSLESFFNTYLRRVNFTYGAAERVESLASVSLEPYKASARLQYYDNDIIRPVYNIYNFNNFDLGGDAYKFEQVGRYLNGRLSMYNSIMMYDETRDNELDPLPRSVCPSYPCKPCLGMPVSSKYLYIPGDIIINGVFSLHEQGSMPLSCGMFDTEGRSGAQFMEAMVFALQKVREWKQNAGILQGVDLGALGFDDCHSGILATHLVTEVQRGARMPPIMDSAGNILDPRLVQSYTAAHSSSLTLPLAHLMNTIQRPLVGYAATTTELSDTDRFPYFLRTIYGNDKSMMAIVKLLKRLNWNYVQTVQGPNAYSRDAITEFRRLAAMEGICVVASYEIHTDGSNDDIVDKLLTRPTVKPVVTVMGEVGLYRYFLEGLAKKETLLTLVAAEDWGDSAEIVKGLTNAAAGTLSLKLKTPEIDDFKAYLSQLRVDTYTSNPWFEEWYEEMHNCSVDGSKTDRNKCEDVPNTPITGGTRFGYTEEVYGVIYAVYSIAYGIDATLKELCGPTYNGICGDFLNSAEKGELMVQKISEAAFTVPFNGGGEFFRFSNREGNFPFEYYNYRADGYYIKVGDYQHDTNLFSLNVDNVILKNDLAPSTITPNCPAPCVECLYLFRDQRFMYIPGDILIPGVFDIHYSGDTPYSCGAMRVRNGYLYSEAFAFALDYINSGSASVRLNNVQLGGVAFDGCSNAVRASTIVSATYSGIFPNWYGKEPMFNSQKFQGWLSYDSRSTVEIANILGFLGVPSVSPGATTPVLNDKQMYNTFFRTIPSETLLIKGMVELARKLGFDYILTLNAPESGSRDAVTEFRKYAEDEGICIGASYEFKTDGDADQLLRYIKQSTTRVVAVFADPDQYISDLLYAKSSAGGTGDIVFIANRPWTVAVDKVPFAQGNQAVERALTFSLTMPTIQQFLDYTRTLTPATNTRNPWYREFYQDFFGCNLPGNWKYNLECQNRVLTNEEFEDDIWVLSTINAVYALAEGVHLTLQEKCGQSYSGICGQFLSDVDVYQRIMSHMDAESFNDITNDLFRFVEREANKGLVISRWSNGAPVNEGSLSHEGTLALREEQNLVQLYQSTPSTCIGQCTQCVRRGDVLEDFTYIRGEVTIVGLFDVHKAGATPYTCGELNTKYGFQLVEAFNYALEYVNDKKGMFANMLPGVDIGGLGFDICQSPTRAGNLVANIQSGNIAVKVDGYELDPNRFDVYIGTQETESSIRVADVLNVLGIPQISYGATSLELRDPRKYRYFFRTVPADDKQARGIISYLKRFDINNVQVLSTFNSVGEMGTEEFYRLAYLNKICVTQNITVGRADQISISEANGALDMLENYPDSKVVILWMHDPRIILQAIESRIEIADNFYFIGTDKWAVDPDILSVLNRLANNQRTISFGIETADLPGFDQYLETKTPLNYERNPWFKDYYEMVFNCSMPGTVGSKYPSVCQTKYPFGISRAPKYIQDPFVLYVVNSVFSAAIGIHKALLKRCGSDYYGLCNLFVTSGQRRQLITQGIKEARFTDATRQPFYFTSSGESDRGHHIYEPRLTDWGPGYHWVMEDVGSYNDSHYLKIDASYDPHWVSNCNNAGSCPCDFAGYTPSKYMLKESPFDLNIVYISDIHQLDPSNPFGCGALDTSGHLQDLLAFFFAISQVNENVDLQLPASLKLGGLALDTCSRPMSIGQNIYSLLSGESICGAGAGQVIPPSTIVAFLARNSPNSVITSGILSPMKITTLSQSATSVELSNKLYHSHFLRMVPPDNIQAIVMAEVLGRFGWDYGTAVYTDNAYGNAGIKTLLERAAISSQVICIGRIIAMPTNATIIEAREVMDQLSQQVGAKVVVLFVTTAHARLLLQAATEKGLVNRFVWLGSDTWANSKYVVEGHEGAAAGAITIQIRSEIIDSFKNYLKSITWQDRKGIPKDWFEEIWQALHQCRILESVVKKQYTRICTGDERITDDMIPQDPYVLHTIISVFMVAQGLNGIKECRSSSIGVGACLSELENKKDLIYSGILGANWQVLPKDLEEKSFNFRLTEEGYGDIGYNILNFRRDSLTGQYDYFKIGSYGQDKMILARTKYQGFGFLDQGPVPVSRCPVGSECHCLNPDLTFKTYRRQEEGTSYYITNDGKYIDPLTGELLTVQGSQGTTDRFRTIWGIIVATLAGIGAFVSLCMFIYLLVVYPVRSGTSILGYMLAFGIILLYGLVFAFVVHATEEICGLRRFCLGFCYSICYSSLFIKLIDCWRNRGREEVYEVKYNKIGQPLGLFFCAVLLVLVQVIINTEWLILQPPDMEEIIYNNLFWPRCTPNDFYDEGLVMSVIYCMVLIGLCVIMGLCTWNNPRNHYESQWILGVSVLSIPVWGAWVLVALLAEYKMRDAAVAVGLLFNATIMLLCGPLRKLYLLNKFQAKLDEDERKSQLGLSGSQGGADYSVMYSRHYDNVPRMQDGDSVRGSVHNGYVYDNTRPKGDVAY